MGRKTKPKASKRSKLKDLSVRPDEAAKAKGGTSLDMMRENIVYTSVSNVLKTKADTERNSISNIR